MPHDVSTHWNSTYDMLSFAIKYHEAIESMTADWKNHLRKFELAEEEWVIAEEVCDMLKACDMVPRNDNTNFLVIIDPQGRHGLLLMGNAKPPNSDPSHGSHRNGLY